MDQQCQSFVSWNYLGALGACGFHQQMNDNRCLSVVLMHLILFRNAVKSQDIAAKGISATGRARQVVF
jgi:hypothetical protein